MSWKTVKLSDIALCIQPGPFGSQLHNADYSDSGTPIIMPKDMIDGHISHTNLVFVSEEHVKRLNRHQVHEGDLMVARKGDVRKCVYISEKENGWMTGSDCLKVSLNKTICDPHFVYYQLRSPYIGKWLETISIGATMPSLNSGLLGSITLNLPSIEEQHYISKVLLAYDDLIENNRRQIKLLEEAAQRLYREWFVDFRFPGHEQVQIVDGVPEGWQKEIVGNLIEKTPRTKQVKTSDYLVSGRIPVIDQSKDFIAGYTNDEETIVDAGKPIIVFGDHTRILKYIQFPFAKGADGTQLIISKHPSVPQSLLYYHLINVDLSNYHYARHFKYLKAEEVLVPKKEISDLFDSYASSILWQIQLLRNTSEKAAFARDILLPKLMN